MSEDPSALGLGILAHVRELEQRAATLREELDDCRARLHHAENALREDAGVMPAEGVWLVEKDGRSKRRIAKLGELPDPIAFAAVARHQDTITQAIVDYRGFSISAAELAGVIVRAVAAADLAL